MYKTLTSTFAQVTYPLHICRCDKGQSLSSPCQNRRVCADLATGLEPKPLLMYVIDKNATSAQRDQHQVQKMKADIIPFDLH